MHIPDGWLSLGVSLFTWIFTIFAVGISLSRIDKDDLDKLSNIGAIASVIFVAQMFNFPIAGGTSGHLLGAALSIYVVGLSGAIIALFTVLMIQAVIFADGGILVLGANTFNMGVIGVFAAFLVIQVFERFRFQQNKTKYFTGVFISSFLAVIVSAFLAGIELVLSGTTSFAASIPPILFWHILIGIGEGIISVFIISYLMSVDFPLYNFSNGDQTPLLDVVKKSNKPVIGLGILLSLLSVLAIFASNSPDGLEFVGEKLNFGSGTSFQAGIADDYSFFGLNNGVGTVLSALLGIIVILGIFILPTMYIKEKRRTALA